MSHPCTLLSVGIWAGATGRKVHRRLARGLGTGSAKTKRKEGIAPAGWGCRVSIRVTAREGGKGPHDRLWEPWLCQPELLPGGLPSWPAPTCLAAQVPDSLSSTQVHGSTQQPPTQRQSEASGGSGALPWSEAPLPDGLAPESTLPPTPWTPLTSQLER